MTDGSTTDDDLIAEGARQLAMEALTEGFNILRHGRPQDKITLIKQLVTPMMRTLGTDDTGSQSLDRMRDRLEQLFDEVRNPESLPAAPTGVVDRDQELRDGPVEPQLGAEGVPGGDGVAGTRAEAGPSAGLEGTAVGHLYDHGSSAVSALDDVLSIQRAGRSARE